MTCSRTEKKGLCLVDLYSVNLDFFVSSTTAGRCNKLYRMYSNYNNLWSWSEKIHNFHLQKWIAGSKLAGCLHNAKCNGQDDRSFRWRSSRAVFTPPNLFALGSLPKKTSWQMTKLSATTRAVTQPGHSQVALKLSSTVAATASSSTSSCYVFNDFEGKK